MADSDETLTKLEIRPPLSLWLRTTMVGKAGDEKRKFTYFISEDRHRRGILVMTSSHTAISTAERILLWADAERAYKRRLRKRAVVPLT